MLDDPDLLAAVAGGGTGAGMLLRRAWDETLRRDPPVQIVLRRTRTEVRVSGGTLPAGEAVACLIGAAGRDPARFAAPTGSTRCAPTPTRCSAARPAAPPPCSAGWRPNTVCGPC